jgi:hypothetical protein
MFLVLYYMFLVSFQYTKGLSYLNKLPGLELIEKRTQVVTIQLRETKDE